VEGDTLATWLDGAGYRTGLFGKYFAYYAEERGVPPGWDRWFALNSGDTGKLVVGHA